MIQRHSGEREKRERLLANAAFASVSTIIFLDTGLRMIFYQTLPLYI